mmetsp:Transcript_29061/g.35398  ORF Transcript_29061/g.35398 Transcript_29061/m.35398 type:complete len:82 (-) Transcript_29061:8-253(-)
MQVLFLGKIDWNVEKLNQMTKNSTVQAGEEAFVAEQIGQCLQIIKGKLPKFLIRMTAQTTVFCFLKCEGWLEFFKKVKDYI